MKIFVPAVGQEENIGDIILRRPLLDWLRESGDLHVYLGHCDTAYETALGLSPSDRVYRSFARWYIALLASAVRRRRMAYAFKPGEIQMTLSGMKEHIAVLPVTAVMRMRRHPIVRVGAGTRDFNRFFAAILRLGSRLTPGARWRDTGTAAALKGATMPDLAFAEGATEEEMQDEGPRDLVVVSMRGDRPADHGPLVAATKRFAATQGYDVVVVSQVLRDNALAESLAHLLDAEVQTFGENEHSSQEQRVRGTYRRAAVVVSDRLHVLIAAVTEGASLVGIQSDGSKKLERHFQAAGVQAECLALDSAEEAENVLLEQLEIQRDRRRIFVDGVVRARSNLADVRQGVLTTCRG
ncbi:hypothetical protein RDV89_10820 [Nocardioides zeae]|uniref:Polysaccharide pyruvyl transferase domain-containing protein n=1 Tax=Nocardioides imazamoxiresistens TaxID=3231893 RepID=A0ABU3PWF1_9ACTN|nr:polysaccharide pyruvyl transferase family protein [Nocardioides zeae]MDT9593561.1 hypothetical protein [Nocardioides zeae]